MLITLNKSWYQAWFRIGVGGESASQSSLLLQWTFIISPCPRCIAFPGNLDGGGLPRTAELMDTISEETTSTVAWDDWGADISITVLFILLFHFTWLKIVFQLFTHHLPHADICQLIAPDILHQLVKGTFKDHLVDWVAKFLERRYGKAGTKEHLADIDHR